MPELPEVETIKEAMRKAVENAVITSVSVRNRHFRECVPDNFEKIVTGCKIVRIHRIAKYAIAELNNNYSIIFHFGMSGKIKFLENMPNDLEKHDHIIFQTTNGVVIYNDPRRFGLVSIAETANLCNSKILSNIGVDPFDKKLTANYLIAKLSKKNIPIKLALLDQSIIAGIGNIYASEALYDAEISPLRKSSDVTKDELDKLIIAVRAVLEKAIKAGGSTLHDYKKPDGSSGYFQLQHKVYGKEGKCCPNCKCNGTHKILRISQGGRSTFYCPCLQK